MRIALDAMGTDRHPVVEVEGAVQALETLPGDFEVILIGPRGRIEEELEAYPGARRDRIRIVDTAQRIDQGESPAAAVRRKPGSSIVVGLTLVKEGDADAFVSAGSTGAAMAASHLLLRPLDGVDRPPVATLLPTAREPVVLVDAGANVDSKPRHLVQFARLGAIYARDVLGRPNPRVGLLNIGEEPEKGNELALEAHRLLAMSGLNFVGNIEGRDIVPGDCDVVVADGFVGNVLLKFYESIAAYFTGLLKRELERSGEKLDLSEVYAALDYTEYGGAPLLGVNGIPIICHGGSPPRAICNAIGVAIRAVEIDLVGQMRRELTASPAPGGDAIGPAVGRRAEGA